ncbi:PqiC family protein [Rhizobacter sp. LjRoot28]|jgi:uncharacterized lipoprotein YmbA|uniref:PqiC family protein n=1 Tax=Rhizobacter sp. LjRoot28 TaxID=3342309 RepID=UPI003ECF68E6
MVRRLLPTALARALATGAACLMAACSSTQPARFHSLAALPAAAPAASSPAAATPWVVDLGPVTVPAGVDQPQWVVRLPDGSLRVLEQERWVAPLRDELRGALLEALRQRTGAIDARTVPAPATSPVRVRLDVQRFETLAGQGAWLEAGWSMAPAGFACRVTLRESAGTGDALALADAHRRAVMALAERIGQSARDGRCPA